MRRCKRCHLPETYETIEFDNEGICNICKSTEHKKVIDWGARKELLDALVEKYRGKSDYDCIVPFSGGKDSTFQLYYLMKEYKLKPLVVRFNHGFMRPTVRENAERTLKLLGADFLEFTPNWKLVKRVMLEAFKRKTDFCWHCHSGIYTYPLQVAIRYNVPLLFWGEPLAEISHYYDYLNDEIEYEDETKFNMCRNLGITAEDMHGMIDSPEDPVDRRDFIPYTYPALKELKRIQYCSVCLGSFIPWDYTKNSEIIMRELGWKNDELEGVPLEINGHGEKIECFMQGARDYIKYMKRGYSRATQITAFHVRNGRMTPEQALPYVMNEGKRPPSLDVLLGYLGMTESEFNTIVRATEVSPYHHDYGRTDEAPRVWDQDLWYKEAAPDAGASNSRVYLKVV
ncbi:N-acetyl sugar amidotransferase [Pendulispora rubella]|uniref:N-acetyl sugar amidotransferase n=1 Tax=Pendulispora rubella TaxID=2741070 RepID=A0ABZ2LGU9_9BACT